MLIKVADPIDIQDLAEGGDTYRNRYWKDSPGGHNKNKFRKLPKKCAMCGTTKGPFDIHGQHGPGTNRKNMSTRKGLKVLCRSCHVKLTHRLKKKSKGWQEAQAILDAYDLLVFDDTDETKAHDTQIIAQGHIIENPDDEMVAKASGFGLMPNRDDNLFTIFKLCHVGTNGNRDHFLHNELAEHHTTARMQPIDWEHSSQNIGLIYDTKFIENDPKDPNPYVLCAGIIWKHKHPDKALKMQERYSQGRLFYSMETHFTNAECSVCKGVFSGGPKSYCSHLKFRFSPVSEAARVLHDINFIGSGVTEKPADAEAINLALL